MNDAFWDELYADVPRPIQPGEKTIQMMIEDTGREDMDFKTMRRQVRVWVRAGRLVSVGNRIYNGKLAEAYKAVDL